jgi:hypothetical protein
VITATVIDGDQLADVNPQQFRPEPNVLVPHMPPGRRLSQHPSERPTNDHRSYLPPPPKPPTSCRTHGGVSPSFLPQEIADAPIPGRSPPAAINGNDHGPQ